MKLFLLTVTSISRCVWDVVISICSLAETFKYFKTFKPFSQIFNEDFTRFSALQILYENCYYGHLDKIRTFVKNSIDGFHGFILPRLRFRKCKFPWLSSWFTQYYLSQICKLLSTVSSGVSACFPLCFLCCFDISPVSPQCFLFFLFAIMQRENEKKKKKNGIGIIHLNNYNLSDTFINI